MTEESIYRAVRVTAGPHGWGGPLTILPVPGRDLIYSVTGSGIHPVARRIAELTGGVPFDGFQSKRDFEEIAVAIIDCGGTARIGIYPMKGVMTIDVHPTQPSGPLFRFIKEELFVSGVSEDDIELVEMDESGAVIEAVSAGDEDETLRDKAGHLLAAAREMKDEAVKKSGFLKRIFGGQE